MTQAVHDSAPSGAAPSGAEGEAQRATAAAEADELAAKSILAIHKLVKLAFLYEEDNESVRTQMDACLTSVADYGKRSGKNLKMFFGERSAWVGSALLRAPRATYELAIELGKMLKRWGVNEMTIGFDVPRDDIRDFVAAVRDARKSGISPARARYTRIVLREGSEPFRGPAHLQDQNLGESGKLIRAYATSIVVMRRFFERVQKGNYSMPARVRRVAQQLADLEAVQMPSFLAATTLRNAASDNASQAVHAALLVVGMGRLLTNDTLLLMRLAMATLLYDTGKPRVAGDDPFGDARLGGMMPKLGEEQRKQLPSATAAMSILMSGINEAANLYSVLVYEAWHVRYPEHCPPPYHGLRGASLEARLVAYARFFTELLASEEESHTPDTAFVCLARQAVKDRTNEMVVRLLLAALGMFPEGALVLLSSGEAAEVLPRPLDAQHFSKPVVRVLTDPGGNRLARPRDVDLADPRAPQVTKLMSLGDAATGPAAPPAAPKSAAPEATDDDYGDDDDDDDDRDDAPAPPTGPPAPVAAPPRLAAPPPAPMPRPMAAPAPMPRPMAAPAPRAPPAPPAAAPAGPPRGPLARARQILAERLVPLTPAAGGTLQQGSLTTILTHLHGAGLTGALALHSPDGGVHIVCFESGRPVKVMTTSQVAALDAVLLEMRAIDAATLGWARAEAGKSGALLGQILVQKDLISFDTLLDALGRQLRQKLLHLHRLPLETRCAIYEGVDPLEDYGGPEQAIYEQAALVLDGLRARPDDSAIAETVALLGGAPLSLHPEAATELFEPQPAEQQVIDWLRSQPASVADLVAAGIAPEPVVLCTLHALHAMGWLSWS